MRYRPDRLKVMPGEIVDKLQPKIDCQRRRPRDRRPGPASSSSSPTEVEQLLATLAELPKIMSTRESESGG